MKKLKITRKIDSADLRIGGIILLIVAVGLEVLAYLGKISRKSATVIFVVVLISTFLLPLSTNLSAEHQFNKGVEEYNTGLDLIRQVPDEIYLVNYDRALRLINEALTHLYKADEYFDDASSLEYYVSEDTSKRIEEAIRKTDEKMRTCRILKAKVYDLIEAERKGSIIEDIIKTLIDIIF